MPPFINGQRVDVTELGVIRNTGGFGDENQIRTGLPQLVWQLPLVANAVGLTSFHTARIASDFHPVLMHGLDHQLSDDEVKYVGVDLFE